MRLGSIVILLLLSSIFVSAKNASKLEVNGYVKHMNTFVITDAQFDNIMTSDLIHHRMNFAYYLNDHITLKTEFRNRIEGGGLHQMQNQLMGEYFHQQMIDGANDKYDLSHFVAYTNSMYWHILFDRAYIDYVNGNWEVRVGRQRINWGINTIYNPNDIFNAMNFFDFDYEERPGSDAVRITKYYGDYSSFELAGKLGTTDTTHTIAGLWKTTKWNYDFQLMGGVSYKDYVFGGGWSGYIKQKLGFKGELSYFKPSDEADPMAYDALVLSLGTDYMTDNEWMFMGGVLYNQQRPNQIPQAFNLFNFSGGASLSAKQLSNEEFTYMGMASKPINQRLSWSGVGMYMPGSSSIAAINTFTYSIKDNWDIDFVSQTFLPEYGKNAQNLIVNGNFLRLKLSY